MAIYFAEPPDGLFTAVRERMVLSADDLADDLVSARPLRHLRVAVLPTADIVIFTIREQRLHMLLRRGTAGTSSTSAPRP